jgi:2-iminobutanoate/2-iminopropanoate deaminase
MKKIIKRLNRNFINKFYSQNKKVINSIYAPKAIGPFSQGINCNNFIFCSGSLGISPETMKIIDTNDVEKQAHQAIKNVGEILKESGATFQDVVKCTIFLTDMANFSKVNKIYEECNYILI